MSTRKAVLGVGGIAVSIWDKSVNLVIAVIPQRRPPFGPLGPGMHNVGPVIAKTVALIAVRPVVGPVRARVIAAAWILGPVDAVILHNDVGATNNAAWCASP